MDEVGSARNLDGRDAWRERVGVGAARVGPETGRAGVDPEGAREVGGVVSLWGGDNEEIHIEGVAETRVEGLAEGGTEAEGAGDGV